MKFQDAKNLLLQDKKVAAAFAKKDLRDLKIHVGLQILELRLIKNLTQKQLAKKIGTEQPSIARAERGAVLPSMSFLHKIASSVGTQLIPPKFEIVETKEMLYQMNNDAPAFTHSEIGFPVKLTKEPEFTTKMTFLQSPLLDFERCIS